jgi:hypothetical protein
VRRVDASLECSGSAFSPSVIAYLQVFATGHSLDTQLLLSSAIGVSVSFNCGHGKCNIPAKDTGKEPKDNGRNTTVSANTKTTSKVVSKVVTITHSELEDQKDEALKYAVENAQSSN